MITRTIIIAIVNSIRRIPALRVHSTSLCKRKPVLKQLIRHIELADVGISRRRQALSDVKGGGCCTSCGAEGRIEGTGVEHTHAHVRCRAVAVERGVNGDGTERCDVVAGRASVCEIVCFGVGV